MVISSFMFLETVSERDYGKKGRRSGDGKIKKMGRNISGKEGRVEGEQEGKGEDLRATEGFLKLR